MRTRHPLSLLGTLLFVAACTAAPAPATSPPAVTGPASTGHVAPTRNEEECRPLADSIALNPEAFDVPAAKMAGLRLPPLDDVPLHLRGRTILVRTRVDARGAVVVDSTTFTPAIGNARYERRFRDVVAEWRFHPAVLHGCAVPTWGTTQVTLDVRR